MASKFNHILTYAVLGGVLVVLPPDTDAPSDRLLIDDTGQGRWVHVEPVGPGVSYWMSNGQGGTTYEWTDNEERSTEWDEQRQ
jgi:hypothetical protein